ncbi:MAG TPA: FHA domain-containing protein, partial [Anaerolineales bacterium]|nr:FHA domain-containing protein [Anaerolineales bacterium]
MMDGFRLVMTQGPQPGQTFNLDKELISIGRDPGNDIVINHPQVSRQHARLVLQGGLMALEDLGSTNGTFVNGMRLMAPHTLANGDQISLGDAVTFTFYGQVAGAEKTVVAHPGTVPSMPPFPPPEPA